MPSAQESEHSVGPREFDEVRSVVTQLQDAMINGDVERLLELIDPGGVMFPATRRVPFEVFADELRNGTTLWCLLFDTECGKEFFRARSRESADQGSDLFADYDSRVADSFRSVQDFFKLEINNLDIDISKDFSSGRIYVTIRLADQRYLADPGSSQLFRTYKYGVYETLTLRFHQVDDEWKIEILFQEVL